jgi:hypothetical protein
MNNKGILIFYRTEQHLNVLSYIKCGLKKKAGCFMIRTRSDKVLSVPDNGPDMESPEMISTLLLVPPLHP